MITSKWPLFFTLILLSACRNNTEKENAQSPANTAARTAIVTNEPSTDDSPPMPVPLKKPDTLYQVFGTEPFWNLVVASPVSTYSSAGGDTLFLELKEIRQAQARPEGYVQVFKFKNHQLLILRQTNNNCSCSDGMSDRKHPLQATLILKEKVLEGCGRTPSHTY